MRYDNMLEKHIAWTRLQILAKIKAAFDGFIHRVNV